MFEGSAKEQYKAIVLGERDQDEQEQEEDNVWEDDFEEEQEDEKR
jgi:hypothetical protein